ncbi:hypothetical protein [Roseateles violae]|uniref:Uncharacterized protein n=1 Tax=Roseateles violae TaxID=3058042 RepID=A0ABT8DUN6_9BURK|nr:hypothetical protein [Pelomonas sp. PFR6]MDN3920745.1 hypothetical protein [Pelomonas sp. PFR6]
MDHRYLLACALLATLPAHAADAPPAVEQLDTVSVSGLRRDAGLIPYGRINELLQGLQTHGQGLFRMEFRLKTSDPARPLPPTKLAIQHEEQYIAIPVQADGLFELPILPQQQAKEADLAINQPKGSMAVQGTLLLTSKPSELDMATVRRIMAVAGKLRSELLPWYLRWLFPQIEGVRVCSAEPAWQLQWQEQGQLLGLPLTADAKDRDPDTPKGAASKPCATLTGEERWPDAARLVAPTDAKLSVRLRK